MSTAETTEVGNYFVANYPPFSFWGPEHIAEVDAVLAREPAPETPLGLYVHLPFCRKRCDFCYFKVYTEKSSQEIRAYLDALQRELDLWLASPYLQGRLPRFVYFGGGTPSYLSSTQLRELFGALQSRLPWDAVEEVTFECEPGTLQPGKMATLRELGVTRLSIGVENFDPQILERNNRAHRAAEVYSVYAHARELGFPQINLDLIAGMVGESDENWSRCVAETARLRPDSVTIYQMEVPFNTTLSSRKEDGQALPIADWETKRRWVGEAFDALGEAGYALGSAYTAKLEGTRFMYRDSLWHGADLLGLGVSSFSHLGGVHFQNQPSLEPYTRAVDAGERPLWRALGLSAEELMRREFLLQMKLGELDCGYFIDKFGVDPQVHFADALAAHSAAGWLELSPGKIRATRAGLLRIDTLLHDFFLEAHRGARYA